ncbi:CheR family methyltransferase [Deltaproteobacteria bacterium TL4]
MPKSLSLSVQEFELMRTLIYNRAGISLPDQKRELLQSRLNKLLRGRPFDSFKAYYDYLIQDRSGKEIIKLVDAVSTNHTYFFRENEHFEFLRSSVLPEIIGKLKEKREWDFRLWCAAASSGEEPYGLLITLMEYLGADYPRWKAGLLATDIAASVLEKAKQGLYQETQLDKVAPALKMKYFSKKSENLWEVQSAYRAEITFRRFNLMNVNFPFQKKFHVIFCRNVMIYFDQPTIEKLVNRLYECTVPGGYLFVGHSESLSRINNPYERYVQPAVYQKI